MNELVSVIVPVYNAEMYIQECMESLLRQTYPYLEIILVNDGSMDASVSLCEAYEKKDERIILVHQDNKGVSAARNHGLWIASGEWVTFVDSDDWVEDNYIQVLLKNASDDVDIVCGNLPKGRLFSEKVQKDTLFMALLFAEHGYAWGKLIRRSCISHEFPMGVQYAEDYIFYIALMKNLRGMKTVGSNGYHYRIRKGSLSVKDVNEAHTNREFLNKYTFAEAYSMIRGMTAEYDGKVADVIWAHCFYIEALLILLFFRISSQDNEKLTVIRKIMRKQYAAFFRNTLCREHRIKRFLFGSMLMLFPYVGGHLADKLLDKQ